MKFTGKSIITHTQMNNTCAMREGETIETKLARLVQTNEPIDIDGSSPIYQERKAGVDPFCDIRTDRMQMAQDAQDIITRTHMLARANRDDFGKKKAEEFTYITDTNGNIVENKVESKSE